MTVSAGEEVTVVAEYTLLKLTANNTYTGSVKLSAHCQIFLVEQGYPYSVVES